MNKPDVTVIVFTRNEERHIERCIRSVVDLAPRIVVVDGFSTDRTPDLCRALGAQVVQHRPEGPVFNFGREINWALLNLEFETGWIFKLDADEFITPALACEIAAKLPALDEQTVGVYIKRRVHFMGKWIRWGDYYPVLEGRIWRVGKAFYEERFADEQLKFEPGRIVVLDNDFMEESLIYLTEWIGKHNGYATREAIDLLARKYRLWESESVARLFGNNMERRRWLKEKLFYRTPYFLRPLLYFAYRYFLRLGFLDGAPGLVWHVLQGFWYRFLVDAKAYQVERIARKENITAREAIRKVLGFDIENR